MSEVEAELRLEASISGFADRVPLLSARNLLSRGQRNFLIGLVIAAVIGFVLNVQLTLTAIIAVFTLLYLVAVIYRAYLFTRSSKTDALEIVTDEEALVVPDSELPFYTILIPAYNEAEVIIKLVENLSQMEYPANRLEVLLLVEADDDETLDALRTAQPPPQFKLVVIPPAEPRTKPKALNFGLTLPAASSSPSTTLRTSPTPSSCAERRWRWAGTDPRSRASRPSCRIGNPTQNIITRWFTVEYAMWFSFFLPGLVVAECTDSAGWDVEPLPACVRCGPSGDGTPTTSQRTADLGIRMFREGYAVRVLNRDTGGGQQRLRELGQAAVALVQGLSADISRPSPLALVSSTARSDLRALATCALFVGGTPILAMLNPLFWAMTLVWFIAHPAVREGRSSPLPCTTSASSCWAFGNFLLLYLTILTARHTRQDGLVLAAVLVPIYWVMMSIAALKAMWQLVITPSFWEKTTHGLHSDDESNDNDTTGNQEHLGLRLVS